MLNDIWGYNMAQQELNLYVFNTAFRRVAIIDKYSSLIWSDRYDDVGDFELTLPYESKYKSIFIKDYYCSTDYSDRWAVIEKIQIDNDEENNATMIISGRQLECILDRRIVLGKTDFGDDKKEVSLQDSIKTLLNKNIISPSDASRKISNFIFQASTDKAITDLKISESFNGNSLFDAIYGICKDKHIGCKILIDSSNRFVFSLYAGRDRSRSQSTNSYVIFSPYYDNLKNSSYFSSNEDYRNVMIVSKSENKFITVPLASSVPSGLSRREVMEDVSSLKENKDGNLSDKQIQTKAKKKLKEEYKMKTGFEGDIVPDVMYKYRTHYNVGDRVQFEDAYGNSEVIYISEVVISSDENGLSILPTFKAIDWT